MSDEGIVNKAIKHFPAHPKIERQIEKNIKSTKIANEKLCVVS